jgi:cation diffusion facilitator family transporter
MASTSSSRSVIYAALAGNLLLALTKFGAAAWTGSAAMLSEGLHSLVDTSNQALLLYGMHRATRPPDERHPLGHGRELYFWSFIVAVLMFSLGAGASVYEGVTHILHPSEIVDPVVNYVVLGVSFVFEFVTWLAALRHFRAVKGPMGYYEAMRRSKDPPSFIVLFEDSAALVGLVIAFIGTLVAHRLQLPIADGIAAIGVGIVLAITATILARESKELLIGEAAGRHVSEAILRLAAGARGIESANGLFTVHLAPRQIVAALSVEFCDDMTAPEIESAVAELEQKIRKAHPEVVALFVKPQTTSTYRKLKSPVASPV